MKASTSRLRHLARIACAGLLLALALPSPGSGPGFGPNFGPSAAQAQESADRRIGILRFLFPRVEKQDRVAPPAAAKPRRQVQRRTAPAQPAVPAVEKAENAKRVLVIGDFLAGGLADGLASAYAENADVVVVGRANGSSGLVRDDHYDWPGNVAAIIEAERPAAVIVMIGSNDRQQMRVGDAREAPRSEAWNAEYERRAAALARAIREKAVPLLWVGNLPFKSPAMSSDMVAFNDIYRRIATDAGGEFIDVWSGFVDEGGNFVANGPDMNGQPAQLRAEDGINVSRAGRRKMAFYVEKPLARLLGLKEGGVPDLSAPGTGPEAGIGPMPGEAVDTARTPPLAIDDIGAEAGSGLLGAVFAPPAGERDAPGGTVAGGEGGAAGARAGRADDFSFRRPDAPMPAAAVTR